MKRIHLLRPGTFASSGGGEFTFSAADLKDIAERYDPQLGEAPLTVGHPKIDDPAFGWVERLEFDAGTQGLYAVPRQVPGEFAEAVKRGAFKKISVALFQPGERANPKPGGYYVRHVGFLGAHVPAIPGLAPVAFASDPSAGVRIEFAAPGAWGLATLMRRLRDYLIAKDGLDAADQALPDYAVQDLEAAARLPDPDNDGDADVSGALPSFAAPDQEHLTMTQPTQAQLDERRTQLEADQATLEADRQALAAQRAEFAASQRRGAITVDVDAAVAAGRVLPAERAMLIEVGSRIAADDRIEFAAADGSKQTVDLLAGWKDFLARLPKRVPLGELAAGGADAPAAVEFAAPNGREVDRSRLDLHTRALDYQRSHPGVDYITAARAVETA